MCLECPKKHKRFFFFLHEKPCPLFDTVKSTPHSQKLVQMSQVPKPRSMRYKQRNTILPTIPWQCRRASTPAWLVSSGRPSSPPPLLGFVCLPSENHSIVGEKVFLIILKPPLQSPLWVLHNRCHYPFWKKVNVFTFTFLATKRQLQRVRSE